MRQLILFILLAGIAVGQVEKPADKPAEPYDVKGVKLGSSLTDWKSSHSRECPESSYLESKDGEVTCVIANASYAGVNAMELVTFYHDRLATLSFQFGSGNFPILRDALKEKFGPPSKEQTKKFQDATGATFEAASLAWNNGASSIQLDEIGVDRDNGLLIFAHLATLAEQDKQNKALRKTDM